MAQSAWYFQYLLRNIIKVIIAINSEVNGIAVNTPDALFVPVVVIAF